MNESHASPARRWEEHPSRIHPTPPPGSSTQSYRPTIQPGFPAYRVDDWEPADPVGRKTRWDQGLRRTGWRWDLHAPEASTLSCWLTSNWVVPGLGDLFYFLCLLV